MKVIYFNEDNFLEEKEFTRNQLAKTLSLNTRDLRPVFSRFQVSTILPRFNTIIINFGFIKAILLKDEIYFLEHYNKDKLESFIEDLKNSYNKDIDISFYLFIFEKILATKLSQISQKVFFVKREIEKTLSEIKKNSSEKLLSDLLVTKKKVSRLKIRLEEILSAVREVLDNEENFEEFASLGKSIEINKEETESILENFLEQIEEELGHINRLDEDIEDTQEFVDLKLSSARTIMTRIDLVATIGSLIFAFLAVIVGLYGVNIRNGLEDSQKAFFILAILLIIFFLLLTLGFWLYFKKKEIL